MAAQQLARLLLVMVIVAAAAPRAHALFGGKNKAGAAEAAMIKWLEGLGGEVHVAIQEPKGGGPRGTYATAAVPRHGLLARVPLKAGIWFPATYDDFSELGATVALEAVNSSSKYAPYLNAVPAVLGAAHSVSFETFPPEYLHLIKSELMAGHIAGTQSTTLKFWARRGADLVRRGVTLDRLRGALSAVNAQVFCLLFAARGVVLFCSSVVCFESLDVCSTATPFTPLRTQRRLPRATLASRTAA